MALPTCNGPFSTIFDRNGFRHEITFDPNDGDPIWGGGPGNINFSSYTWEINIGTTALGPFTPAPLADISSACTSQPDNIIGIGGGSNIVGVGGSPSPLFAGTDYYLEYILRDETATPVPGGTFVCGPITTFDYPTVICLPNPDGFSSNVLYGTISGRFNLPPCRADQITWEISSVGPAGPFTPEPVEDVTSLSPSHTFTGLAPNTTYWARARVSEVNQTQGEYLVGPVCEFTTLNAVSWCGAWYNAENCEFVETTNDPYWYCAGSPAFDDNNI